MVVKSSQRHLDDEADGKRALELVVVTYTGPKSVYSDPAVRIQGHWPAYSTFQAGIPEVALVPDEGLGYFESHADFDIEYGREPIAEALLDKNYIAPEVFSAGSGGKTRQRILDELGIERVPTTEEGIREELVEIAGREEDPDEEPVELPARLTDKFTRQKLKDAADELREDADDIELTAGKTEFAEWLAGQDMTETELFTLIRGDETNKEVDD